MSVTDTQSNKELVHTTAKRLNALSESSRRKVFEELESKCESKAVNEIVSIAQTFSKSEVAALKREINRKRPRKDPNAPKGPSSAYLHYSKNKVRELKEDNEDLSHKDATKRCGALWNAMSAEDKAPYVKMAEEDRARYVEEKERYVAEHGDEIKQFGGKRVKKEKDPNAPKRNCNAFMHFSPSKVRELKEQENLTHRQATSRAGEVWKGMTEEEKQPFVYAAESDKGRYVEEMAIYNEEKVVAPKTTTKTTTKATTKATAKATPTTTTKATPTTKTPTTTTKTPTTTTKAPTTTTKTKTPTTTSNKASVDKAKKRKV